LCNYQIFQCFLLRKRRWDVNVYFRLNIQILLNGLITCTGILLVAYALLIFYYHRAWDSIPQSSGTQPDQDIGDISDLKITVSVIIPARNEERYIEKTLQSLTQQNYPPHLTEIIIINDFSTDATARIVRDYSDKITLLNLADYVELPINSYKKKAIETGITHSKGELIICSDADCLMNPGWIRQIVRFYEKEKLQFIAAPVKIIPNKTFLSVFQALDFISLQGITGAAVYKNIYPMCNGANMAYTRKAYEAVNGFETIDHIASGDDMLLMKKIQTLFPGKLGYLKDPEAIVSTFPAENVRSFFSQRIRWASKLSHYKDPATWITLSGVYLVNLCLVILFISCFFQNAWRWLLVFIAFKTISEVFFVQKVAIFFQQLSLIKFFPFCQPFHILYTVIAGAFGSFGKYDWKNRKVK
jgi:cellulose synthase/poly-beta-1,6-N-acetylglucosamine synthase-like glycosyltransferase